MKSGSPAIAGHVGVASRPSASMLSVLSWCSAIGVGMIYFPQALIPHVSEGLQVSLQSAAMVVTAPQLGYAVGIALIVPLADIFSARKILMALFLGTTCAALTASLTTSLAALLAASFLMGCATVASPVIGPFAATMTGARRLGFVGGLLLSACIGGIIVSRALAGLLADGFTWRAPYAAAALLAASCLLAVALSRGFRGIIPRGEPSGRVLLRPAQVFRSSSVLRASAFNQACVFAGFTATWTTLALVLRDQFGYGSTALGAVSFVAAATLIAAPFAGRACDRFGPDRVNTWSMSGVIVAAAVMASSRLDAPMGVAALVVGVLLLDVAMQTGMIANTTRFFLEGQESLGAKNTAYMMCAFAAGSAGSWAGVQVYVWIGWLGVCAGVGALGAVALTVHLSRQASRAAS